MGKEQKKHTCGKTLVLEFLLENNITIIQMNEESIPISINTLIEFG